MSPILSEGRTILCEDFVRSHINLLLSSSFLPGLLGVVCGLNAHCITCLFSVVVDLEHFYCSGMPAWFSSSTFILEHPLLIYANLN